MSRKFKFVPLSLHSILLVLIIAASYNVFNVYAGSTIYDFIVHASEASWSSEAGVLGFPGNPANSSGFARYVYNAILEDGSTWQRVLETHPQWVSGGWIMGMYPQQTVPAKVQLTVRIGFISGATGTDGALFKVYFDEFIGMQVPPTSHTIISQFVTLDNKLDLITKDLGFLAGRKGNFILYVNAGQTSNRDWAIWAEAKIETIAMPDLVITDIIRNDDSIRYKVKNIGDAATTAKSFSNALNVDGKKVAEDTISQILQPGQEVESSFDYTFQPEPGRHVIRVCADSKQNVDESDEQNNCLEETWVEEKLPDLVIVEVKCDRNNSIVGYVLKNIGDETATGGHQTTLYLDSKEITHDLVRVDLGPGKTYESWFKEYEWPECQNITVKVCADNYNQVKESDEGNNCLEKKCVSYPVSIAITSGPKVVNVTQDMITITWVTNKNSDSSVVYTDRASGEEKTVYDPSPVKNHQIILKGLKARTTYRFYVASKDQCGNSVISKSRVFETISSPDEESPSVTLFLPENLSGVVDITANATDNIGVTEVMFLVDAHVKFMDFSPPYSWTCDTTLYPNGVHSFRAVAFDAALNSGFDARDGTINNLPRDVRPPFVSILRPHDGDIVEGMVEIETIIQDMALAGEPIGRIQKVEIYVDSVLVRSWVYSPFRFDIFRRELVPEAPTNNLRLTYLWNTTGLVLGSEHKIEVKGWDDSGNEGSASSEVTVLRFKWLPPTNFEIVIIDVEFTREVVRYGNWFDVSLTIRNTGNRRLEHFRITDLSLGFQAIALPMPLTSRDTNVSFHDWRYSEVTITPLMETLNPGESWIFHYYAVPILFCNPRLYDDAYVIGFVTYVDFKYNGTPFRRTFELPRSPGVEDRDRNGFYDLDDAFKGSDYLLITHPRKLFEQNPTDSYGVNLLLQEMATLAKMKNGILGYLRGEMTPNEIKSLILPSGEWAMRLGPTFRDPNPERNRDAYILIVGGGEIVPAPTMTGSSAITGWSGSVKLCDQIYSDVVGADVFPDLILGRIVGETARSLTKPIQTSISVALGYGFDRSFALGVSGYEDAGYAVHAVDIAEDVVRDLARQGVSGNTLHWSNFIQDGWSVRFTDYDAFALGDVDRDGIDEVLIASDEHRRIYIYEAADRRLVRDFPCVFTRYDGFATGDLDGDSVDEIVIARDDDNTIYVYEPDGTLAVSVRDSFTNWDAVATGKILSAAKDNVLVASHDRNLVKIYTYILGLTGYELRFERDFPIVDFTRDDGFAVGNVANGGLDEILIARDEDSTIYVYSRDGVLLKELKDLNGDGRNDVRYTPYDGFAVGDIDGDRFDEIVVLCDGDKSIYYYWEEFDRSTGIYVWKWSSLFSRFMSDWFSGVRYTGSPTRHDGFAVGNVVPGDNAKIAILMNRNGDSSSFEVLVPTWDGANKWANKRLSVLGYSDIVSFIVVYGHGNPHGASPLGIPHDVHWGDFLQHPFVFSMGCDSGDYESWGDSFSEAFFRHGAGIFVGPTEDTICCISETVTKEFFELWDIWRMRAGKAYTLYERRMCRAPANDPVWALVFNYYGDPKFPTGG